MDMQQIGYYLYMTEMEKKQEQLKVNAENNSDLVGEMATTNEETGQDSYFSRNIAPSKWI